MGRYRSLGGWTLGLLGLLAGCAQPAKPSVQPINSEAAGDLNAAYSSFEGVKEPKLTAKTHLAAARLAESRGDQRQAILQYQEVLKIDATSDEALYRLGVLLTEQKRFDEALAIWKRYAAATDGSPTALANLGFCLQVAGKFDEAEAAYRQGLARDPKSEACRVNLGLLYGRQGKYDEAFAELSAVLEPAEAWYDVGSAAEARPDVAFAREAYARALKIRPDFAPAQRRLETLPAPAK